MDARQVRGASVQLTNPRRETGREAMDEVEVDEVDDDGRSGERRYRPRDGRELCRPRDERTSASMMMGWMLAGRGRKERAGGVGGGGEQRIESLGWSWSGQVSHRSKVGRRAGEWAGQKRKREKADCPGGAAQQAVGGTHDRRRPSASGGCSSQCQMAAALDRSLRPPASQPANH